MSLISKIAVLTSTPCKIGHIAAVLGMHSDDILPILENYQDVFQRDESGKWCFIAGATIPPGPEYSEEHFFGDYEQINGTPPLLSDDETSDESYKSTENSPKIYSSIATQHFFDEYERIKGPVPPLLDDDDEFSPNIFGGPLGILEEYNRLAGSELLCSGPLRGKMVNLSRGDIAELIKDETNAEIPSLSREEIHKLMQGIPNAAGVPTREEVLKRRAQREAEKEEKMKLASKMSE